MIDRQLSIKKLFSQHHLGNSDLPQDLLDKLKANDIESLEQVRRQGGIPDLAELSPEEQQVS
ncbi:MAG: hypothetical protein QNJ46_16210 [Leptolyngbyaceae cyanobacterium MO_188.B28]|nr:hypothetical protein [Leptolyngbyaceae cyanobacterium MO_188.B28]